MMIKEIFNGQIQIEYSKGADNDHYEITPYSFRPRIAKKYVSSTYHDLGQGILDVLYDVYEKADKHGEDIAHIRRILEPKWHK